MRKKVTVDTLYKDATINQLQDTQNTTKRAISPELEEILYQPIKVLDHGFIRVVDYMGNDNAVVQAARVSYGTGTKQTNQDGGLIHYLMRHRHTTPFEMCEIKFHIKLPIFIARQWIRHRTASVNEYSARYSIMGSDFYIPAKENIAPQSKVNKQCREEMSVPAEFADEVIRILKEDAERCYDHYTTLMNEDEAGNIIDENKHGIARELARMNLTLNYYTEWYWKIDLHNLLHFLALRADSHAQYEIRAYAEAMLDVVKRWVPISYEAFEEYRLKGSSLSKNAVEMIKKRLRGENVSQEQSGMTKREWSEVASLFELE
jgi:thymidylate synthase (FAD)